MWEFFSAGGPFMVLLLLTSLVAVAFILERGLALRWSKVIPPGIQGVLAPAAGCCGWSRPVVAVMDDDAAMCRCPRE